MIREKDNVKVPARYLKMSATKFAAKKEAALKKAKAKSTGKKTDYSKPIGKRSVKIYF